MGLHDLMRLYRHTRRQTRMSLVPLVLAISLLWCFSTFAAYGAPTAPAAVEGAAVVTSNPSGEAVPAPAPAFSLVRDGRTITFSDVNPASPDPFIYLDDPGMPKLFDRLRVITQWAEGTHKLLVFGPDYEAHWVLGQKTATINGKALNLPAALERREGRLGAPLSAWTALLGLRYRVPKSGSPGVLDTRIDEISLDPATGRDVVFKARAPFAWQQKDTDSARKVVFELSQVALATPRVDLHQDGLELALAEKSGQVSGMIRFPADFVADAQPRLKCNELVVAGMPDYHLWLGYTPQSLELAGGRDQSAATIQVKCSGPVQYFWTYDSQARRLLLDLPQASASPQALQGVDLGSFAKGRLIVSNQPPYPVTRLALDLSPGTVFQLAVKDGNILEVSLSGGDGSQLLANGEGATGAGSAAAIIVIDPGHGGCDPGAVNRQTGQKEKDITLDVALRLQEILTQRGWQVVLTRTTDTDVSWANSPDDAELGARTAVANNCNAVAFISLHCNASVSSSSNGCSLHWYKSQDKVLASYLEEMLGEIGVQVKGLHRDRFYVLRHTRMPSVLVEMAFISNPRDSSLLRSSEFRQRVAEHLAQGLGDYMRSATAAAAGGTGD